jgi:hypothetical protein
MSDKETHGISSRDFWKDYCISSRGEMGDSMGDDARTEALAEIQSKLISVLDTLGKIEGHVDLKFYMNLTESFADMIYDRETAYRAIIATLLEAHDWHFVSHEGKIKLFVEERNMLDAPPSIIIEKAVDKHGYYIRVGH